MKPSTRTYAVVILIAIAIIVFFAARNGSEPSSDRGMNEATSTMGQAVLPSGSAVKSPSAASRSTSGPNSGSNSAWDSYTQSVNKFYANQDDCKTAATRQYQQLYASTLLQSSLNYYLNVKTGVCYMQTFGSTQDSSTGTSTQHLYFRNVSSGVLVAECKDTAGVTLANSEWVCTDKKTGGSITKIQYNALVSQSTSQ